MRDTRDLQETAALQPVRKGHIGLIVAGSVITGLIAALGLAVVVFGGAAPAAPSQAAARPGPRLHPRSTTEACTHLTGTSDDPAPSSGNATSRDRHSSNLSGQVLMDRAYGD
jgi:hypothetical protein